MAKSNVVYRLTHPSTWKKSKRAASLKHIQKTTVGHAFETPDASVVPGFQELSIKRGSLPPAYPGFPPLPTLVVPDHPSERAHHSEPFDVSPTMVSIGHQEPWSPVSELLGDQALTEADSRAVEADDETLRSRSEHKFTLVPAQEMPAQVVEHSHPTLKLTADHTECQSSIKPAQRQSQDTPEHPGQTLKLRSIRAEHKHVHEPALHISDDSREHSKQTLEPGFDRARPTSRQSLKPPRLDTSICSSRISLHAPSLQPAEESQPTTTACTSSKEVSPVSARSTASTLYDQVTILQSEGECWILPNVTVQDAISHIRKHNTIKISDFAGAGHRAVAGYNGSASTSPDISPTSAASTSPSGVPRASGKRGTIKGRAGRSNRVARSSTTRTKLETGPKRYGCPFSKHNPERYNGVFNSCTTCPGMEWKYLMCIYCRKVWSSPNWYQELRQHIDAGECPKRDNLMSRPECMSDDQEAVYRDTTNDSDRDTDAKWVSLYMRLFPGEYPIPIPEYDFYVPRHRVTTPVPISSAAPFTNIRNSPRTRTWYVFSQNTDDDWLAGFDFDTTAAAGNVFSSPVDHTQQQQAWAQESPTSASTTNYPAPGTLEPVGSAAWSERAVHGAGNFFTDEPMSAMSDPSMYHDGTYVYDGAFFESQNTLVLPEAEGDGMDHFWKWMGQNVPEDVSPVEVGQEY